MNLQYEMELLKDETVINSWGNRQRNSFVVVGRINVNMAYMSFDHHPRLDGEKRKVLGAY
jgi:hypothetical protein